MMSAIAERRLAHKILKPTKFGPRGHAMLARYNAIETTTILISGINNSGV